MVFLVLWFSSFPLLYGFPSNEVRFYLPISPPLLLHPKSSIPLKSYLYTAVRNRSFNYLRDEKRRSIREAQFLNNLKAEEEGYNSALENEIYRQLKLLLEELPEQCKNIFQRTLSGDTSEKIAADLKLSVETVKTQRKKAKRILRERYTLLFKTFGILF